MAVAKKLSDRDSNSDHLGRRQESKPLDRLESKINLDKSELKSHHCDKGKCPLNK